MKTVLLAATLLTAPHSPVIKAGCVAYQVCQTCYRQDSFGNTTTYQCNCHMECMPGTGN